MMRTYKCKDSYFLLSVFVILCLNFCSVSVFAECPSADLTEDCVIDFNDLNILAIEWLNDCNLSNQWCDGADLNTDDIVDFTDFAAMVSQWLVEGTAEPAVTWGYINDPGVSGHEAFTGYMSKHETTNAQYCFFLNHAFANGDVVVTTITGGTFIQGSGIHLGYFFYKFNGVGEDYNGATNGGASRINWTGESFTVDSGFENHPVTFVNWYGATAFASYYGWRLPTEWEWQAVADYDGSYTYGCGTTIDNNKANYLGSTHPNGTTAVGSFGTYGYGMCDMAGNAFEWTSSTSIFGGSYRVLKGGCWVSDPYSCTVSYVFKTVTANTMAHYTGFRVCY